MFLSKQDSNWLFAQFVVCYKEAKNWPGEGEKKKTFSVGKKFCMLVFYWVFLPLLTLSNLTFQTNKRLPSCCWFGLLLYLLTFMVFCLMFFYPPLVLLRAVSSPRFCLVYTQVRASVILKTCTLSSLQMTLSLFHYSATMILTTVHWWMTLGM